MSSAAVVIGATRVGSCRNCSSFRMICYTAMYELKSDYNQSAEGAGGLGIARGNKVGESD